MNQLTNEEKAVLRLIAVEIEKQDLEGRLNLWRGLAQIASEQSHIGHVARENQMILEHALRRQQDFFATLAADEPQPPIA